MNFPLQWAKSRLLTTTVGLRPWEFPIAVQDFLARAIDALPEGLADKAHKQTICSTGNRVV
jgi:hypothetical protein